MGKDSIMLPSGVIHVHLLGNYLIIEGNYLIKLKESISS